MTRILLADDHTLVRQGLRRILEEQPDWQVVAETGNGLEAVRLTAELQPDIVILDIGMPQLNGLEAARQITSANAAAKVVFLTVHADPDYLRSALAVGALGYVVKERLATDLIPALWAAVAGRRFVSPSLAGDVESFDSAGACS